MMVELNSVDSEWDYAIVWEIAFQMRERLNELIEIMDSEEFQSATLETNQELHDRFDELGSSAVSCINQLDFFPSNVEEVQTETVVVIENSDVVVYVRPIEEKSFLD